jgi:hypothetical protein
MDEPTEVSRRPWTGRLALYHPTRSGGGAAARLEFHPAQPDRYGCFFLEMARQKTSTENGEGTRRAATFDWEAKLTVKLGLPDVCSLLLVLEGRREQAGNGRDGLFHDTDEASTVINLRRQDEPAGYALEVSRKPKQEGSAVTRMRVVLSEGEAIRLRCGLQAALFPMVFGVGEAQGAEPRRVREA